MEHNGNLVLYLRGSTFKICVPELSALLTIQGSRYWLEFASKAGQKHLKKRLCECTLLVKDFRRKKKILFTILSSCWHGAAGICPMPVPHIRAPRPEPTSGCSALGICNVTRLPPRSLQSEVIGTDQPT